MLTIVTVIKFVLSFVCIVPFSAKGLHHFSYLNEFPAWVSIHNQGLSLASETERNCVTQ